MKKVTKWDKLNPVTNIYEHNHLEDGHCAGNFPTPNFKLELVMTGNGDPISGQPEVVESEEYKKKLLAWSLMKWRKQFGYLDMSGKYQPMRT
jgi:hypothetical protein